jgi:putative nucleotidyltransferase with HDIG domain
MTAASGRNGPGESRESVAASWVGVALEAALCARAPGVHASTPTVRQLALKVSRELGLGAETQAILDIAVRVRDIGMLALPDSVVLATTPLSPADWDLVIQHPVIGAQLLEGLSVAAPAAQIVRAHHERWDGGGYPDGCRGDAIPLLSRVIAPCDAFVAIASDRPYRRGLGAETALAHVCEQRGSQFDPDTVDALVDVLAGTKTRKASHPDAGGADPVIRVGIAGPRARSGRSDLTSTIAEFDLVPAFAPAYERVLAITATGDMSRSDLVAAIETDTGLTIAVLRRAQTAPAHRPIANVPDAVAALSTSEIEAAIKGLPRAEFPWGAAPLKVLMHRGRVHAQAVARAADRIAREVNLRQRDDVMVAALLHDVGKLVIGRARPDYSRATDAQSTTPEERIREERRALGTDHAVLGGFVLRRWGLPQSLVDAVAAHHSSDAADEAATYVRLADMVAHHAQGEAVNRRKMLRLAHVCRLSSTALRNVLFDLPQGGGSQRRRADPSPLTDRETLVVQLLAQGKVYGQIASELSVTPSTVRGHLHNAYQKLGVPDRAHAVIRATEMGWI